MVKRPAKHLVHRGVPLSLFLLYFLEELLHLLLRVTRGLYFILAALEDKSLTIVPVNDRFDDSRQGWPDLPLAIVRRSDGITTPIAERFAELFSKELPASDPGDGLLARGESALEGIT